MEQLAQDGHFDEYLEPTVPFCFLFVYNSFLEMYNGCSETLTWTDITNYGNIRKIDFTQNEIDYILKCNSWASGKIKKMRNEGD